MHSAYSLAVSLCFWHQSTWTSSSHKARLHLFFEHANPRLQSTASIHRFNPPLQSTASIHRVMGGCSVFFGWFGYWFFFDWVVSCRLVMGCGMWMQRGDCVGRPFRREVRFCGKSQFLWRTRPVATSLRQHAPAGSRYGGRPGRHG